MEEFQFYTLSLTILALFYAWCFIRSVKSGGRETSPPSPPTLPVIGNLHQLGRLAHRSLWDLSRKHGPLMLLHFGQKPALVVSSAKVAKEVLKTHDLTFADKIAMSDAKKIFYDLSDIFNLPYGDTWRKLRSIVVHELLSSSRVMSFSSIRDEEIALFIENIQECCSFDSSTPVNLTNMFAALSNDLISRAAFGKKHGEEEHGKKFLEVLEESVGLLGNLSVAEFIPWLAWIDRLNGRHAALDRIAEKMDEILDAIIEDHLRSSYTSNKENFMDILLGIYKGDTPGVSIDLISLKSVILDIFAAGTETTATTLVWLMTELLRQSRVMKKLQDEVRGIMKGKHHISDDELQKMHYLKAVIKETLRLHPAVTIFIHVAREYVNLMGYEIAPETLAVVNVWALGRDPACWDEPEKFVPERFLNSSLNFKGFDFELIPFGAGRRICPGIGFAAISLEHTVANLMLRFDWALPDGAKGEDLDITERPGITIRKKNPLLVVATVNPSA
ncbi:hypothetical protein C2S53_018592 [Perilla frutescens var. hirtella]|uniref:Cytochrome P450 n=1 Tax=Perilla frutescens var. hirtella TaxID=608512 RepID=A0AAD4IS83_PERFH|nr:hypothetical protein C2S53_018592 [Perilla frutescens var. hirtella]